MFSSVRTRLTLWYVGVLGVVLIPLGMGVYILLARSLYDQLDARLSSTLQATIAALKHTPVVATNGAQAVTQVLEDLRFPNQAVAVLDEGRQVIAQKVGANGPPLRLPSPPFNPSENMRFYELPDSNPDISDDSCRGVFQRVTHASTGATYAVVVVQSLEPLSDQLDLLLEVLYIVVPLSLVSAGLGGWFLGRRSLAPVVQMSELAQRISAHSLEQRIPVVSPRDELGRLASTFNDLLSRLGSSFAQQQQFMADASHELRTPLSIMRTAAQVTLQQAHRQEGEYRDALVLIENQTQRLTRIVEDIFLLARADAARSVLQPRHLYLDELLAESVRAAGMLASRKGVKLRFDNSIEAPYRGDEELLRQMLLNLLDNAIKYSPAGGIVGISLDKSTGGYSITITDTGPGIPLDVRPHIFERFYRADNRPSSLEETQKGGAGLGLPIARWIAEAHRGGLILKGCSEKGSTFLVSLPSF